MNVFMIVGGALLFVVAFFALMGLVLGLATSVIQIIVVVLCSGFGAGMTWASALLRWGAR